MTNSALMIQTAFYYANTKVFLIYDFMSFVPDTVYSCLTCFELCEEHERMKIIAADVADD